MRFVELIIDEEQDVYGIEAISLVDEPAIEMDFIALKKHLKGMTEKVQFAVADEEKRTLIGPALVPDKPIYRNSGDDEYYVYFSKRTVKKAMELFQKSGMQKNWTLHHDGSLEGLSVVESWIVDDPKMDKSQVYGMEVPKGTWMVSVKVDNDEVWMEQVKEGNVKGFSIEGYFVDKAEMLSQDFKDEDDPCWEGYEMIGFKMKNGKKVPNCVPIEMSFAEMIDGKPVFDNPEDAESLAKKIGCEGHHVHSVDGKDFYMPCAEHSDLTDKILEEVKMESYTDYPDAVKNNAKKVIEFTEKNGWGDCGTPVGKTRANTLAKGEPVSVDTIKRMNSYLIRHKKDLEASTSYTDGCGLLMYDSWGGRAALRWTESKLKELELVAEVEDAISKEG
jgi:hypothetical protein